MGARPHRPAWQRRHTVGLGATSALLVVAGAASFVRSDPLASVAEPTTIVVDLDSEALVDLKDPDRAPIDFPVGEWGHVTLPAGWVPGFFIGRGPRGEVRNWTFENKNARILLHFDDASGQVTRTDIPPDAPDGAKAEAAHITADLEDGE